LVLGINSDECGEITEMEVFDAAYNANAAASRED
jgi:hypothetical protein